MNTTTTIRGLALLSLTATLIPFGLLAQGPAHFNLPFGFTVGAKYLEPGNYSVAEVTPHVLQIRSEAGKISVFVMGSPDEPGKLSGKMTMTFQRYGEQYFLSKVADSNHGWRVPKSATEKELLGRISPAQLGVVASIRK
jgi:hypothetical protein